MSLSCACSVICIVRGLVFRGKAVIEIQKEIERDTGRVNDKLAATPPAPCVYFPGSTLRP